MSVSLEVSKREVRPRSIKNKLRHEGRVPAIINGYQIESTPISVDAKEFAKVLRDFGLNSVVKMEVNGASINTLIQRFTRNTFTGEFTHIDFLSVDMTEETIVEAEVVLVGTPAGVKIGGSLTQNLYNVLVSATPDKLPETVEIDISNLEINQSITVADLPVSPDYQIVTAADEQIAAITEGIGAAEEEETEEA